MAKTKTQRHNYTPRKRPNWPVALIPVDATRTAFLRSMANRRFNRMHRLLSRNRKWGGFNYAG
jgi:hypothetical protein